MNSENKTAFSNQTELPSAALHKTSEFGKLSKTNLLFRIFKILSPHSGNYEGMNCHAESGGTER